jgi:hypothetical protein
MSHDTAHNILAPVCLITGLAFGFAGYGFLFGMVLGMFVTGMILSIFTDD